MKFKTLSSIVLSSLLVVACGGGGGGSGSTGGGNTGGGNTGGGNTGGGNTGGGNTGGGNTGGGNTGGCLTAGTITISGISVVIADFDTNEDGCLSSTEMVAVNAYVAEQNAEALGNEAAELAAKTVDGVIHNTNSNITNLVSVSIVGNAESVDGVAQIHNNMEDGEFTIQLTREDVRDEHLVRAYIVVGNLGEFSSGQYTMNGDYNYFANTFTELFYIDGGDNNDKNLVNINCLYNTSLEGTCRDYNNLYVTPTQFTIPADNTYIYVFLCSVKFSDIDENDMQGYTACDNYAKIPVRFI